MSLSAGGGDITKTWVNGNQMDLLHQFYHEDAIVQLCRTTVLRTLLNGGLVMRGGPFGKTKPTPAFARIIERYWVPFVGDLYDALTCFGMCVYSSKVVHEVLPTGNDAAGTTASSERPVEVPYVLPFGSYRVEIRRGDDAWPTYHVYRVARSMVMASDSEPDPSLRVLLSRHHRPTINGHVRSVLLPLLPLYRFSSAMHAYALQTEQRRARPPLICETRPESTNASNDVVALEMFGDGDAFESRAESSYAKSRAAMNAFHRQQNMAAVLNGKHPSDAGVYIDPFTGAVHKQAQAKQVWEDSVFVLPHGQRMCTPMRTDARPDLLEIENHRVDVTCAIFGVPKSVVLNARTASAARATSAGADVAQRVFMRAMDATAAGVVRSLTEVYHTLYGAEGGGAAQVTISFPFLPVLDIEQLLMVGELGLVPRAVFAKRMLATIGLPMEDMRLVGKTEAELMTRPEKREKKPPAPGGAKGTAAKK